MTRKIGFSKVSWLGVLAGLLGYFFHATMRSGGSAIPLVAFSVLMALLFWLSAVTLEKKSRYDEVFRPMRSDFICNTLGAIGLGAGCVLSMQAGGTFVRLIGLLGLERRRNRGSRHRPSGAFRRAGAFARRRVPDETGRAVCHVLCPGDFVLRMQAVLRLPPLDARPGDSGLLLLPVCSHLLYDRDLPRDKLLV